MIKHHLYEQPTAAPTRKVGAGALTVPLTTIVVWIVTARLIPAGTVPPDVELAIGGLIGTIVAGVVQFVTSYMVKDSI